MQMDILAVACMQIYIKNKSHVNTSPFLVYTQSVNAFWQEIAVC